MTDVFAIQGLLGEIFSEGMETLCERYARKGERWIDFNHNTPKLTMIKKRRPGQKLVVVGHSLGARRAIKIASDYKFDVSACICLDYVCNLFGKNDLVAPRGIPTYHFRSDDFRTRRLDGATEISVDPLNHIQMDDDANVLMQINEIIRKLT